MRKDVEFDDAKSRSAHGAIAEAFVWARLAGVKLDAFPGTIPASLREAYGVQDAAIARWPEDVVGWKVGWIAPRQRDGSGDGRLVGPIFRGALRTASTDACVAFPVFDGGFAAVEAEFVFRLARDAEPDRTSYTSEDAAALVGAMHVGVETAGSPLATINVLGPNVVVSDFGNNAGLILGPEIADWRSRGWPSLACETFVDGVSVGRGDAASVENGPLDSLAFALGRLAARGRALKAGDVVTTGAVTGIHDIVAGQEARVDFAGRRIDPVSRGARGAASMIRCSRRAFLGGALATAAATQAAVRDPQARVLTATDVHVKGYPTVLALQWIGEQLALRTDGRLTIRLYHSGQLGRESDAIDLARFGALDIARVHMGSLNNPFPATRVLSAPYVFDSAAHMRRALDGAPGRAILQRFADRDLVGLAFYDSGARCFYNTRRALHAPADLAGLKIRVPPSDLFMRMVRALGANPTPLPYGEVFSALQTHLIDGAENNWKTFHTTRQFEEARFWSNTEHSYAPEALLMSRRTFDTLAAQDQDLLRELADASVPFMRGHWDRTESETRATVIAAGVAVNDVDREAFRRAATPVLEKLTREDPGQADLYRAIRAMA